MVPYYPILITCNVNVHRPVTEGEGKAHPRVGVLPAQHTGAAEKSGGRGAQT